MEHDCKGEPSFCNFLFRFYQTSAVIRMMRRIIRMIASAPFLLVLTQRLFLKSEYCVSVVLAVEQTEILRLFSQSNKVDRDPEFAVYRNDRAALGSAVEFGEDQPGEAETFVEGARLQNGVGANASVYHEPTVFGGLRVELLEDATDLGELIHQVAFGVQPSGGIEDQIIRPSAGGRLIGIKGDGCRIGPLLAGNERQVEPLAPGLELFVRGGPKGVACSDKDGLTLIVQPFAEFGSSCGFSRTVDPDQADDLWFAFGLRESSFRSLKPVHQHAHSERGGIFVPHFLVGPIAFFDRVHHLIGGFEAEIRTVEGFLHEADGVIIQFSPAEDGRHFFGGFGETGSEETE